MVSPHSFTSKRMLVCTFQKLDYKDYIYPCSSSMLFQKVHKLKINPHHKEMLLGVLFICLFVLLVASFYYYYFSQ